MKEAHTTFKYLPIGRRQHDIFPDHNTRHQEEFEFRFVTVPPRFFRGSAESKPSRENGVTQLSSLAVVANLSNLHGA